MQSTNSSSQESLPKISDQRHKAAFHAWQSLRLPMLCCKPFRYWFSIVHAWNALIPHINAICILYELPTFSRGAKHGYKPHFKIEMSAKNIRWDTRTITNIEPVSEQAKTFWRVIEQLEIEYQLTQG